MNQEKQITIIIPVRNESNYIATCLESVINFIIPEGCAIEVIVIDGMSDDTTRSIAEKKCEGDARIHLLENPQRIQAAAMNMGIKEASGKHILRLDAHSVYPKNYLQLIYATYLKTAAENVGGQFITRPGGKNYSAQLVQALTTHPFGVGNAGFRTGAGAGYADTVPYGFYKKELFERIGYFDERLVRAQDYEFNRRIIKAGGKIWRNPDIQVNYYNQADLFRFLKKQFFLEAPYNAYMWYLAPYTFAYRHAVTAVFALGFVCGLLLSPFFKTISLIFLGVMAVYLFLSVLAAIQQAGRYKNYLHLVILPFGFFLYHFIHGLGVLLGLIKLLFRLAPVQKVREPWKNAGKFRAWQVVQANTADTL